jgi:ATP-dependent Clp protease ATP-binding subunit ClpB
VQRVIQRQLENEIAREILRGELGEDDTVVVDTEITTTVTGEMKSKLKFSRRPGGASADTDRKTLQGVAT